MDTLRRQIARAQRRLLIESFLAKLAWCWFATLSLAALAIGLGKLWPELDQQLWTAAWLGGALGAGLIAAMVWAWLRRASALAAAVELDRRFDLKERVSSALALGAASDETPIGQALVRDAEHRVSRVDVAQRFGVRPGRHSLLPLVPAALAFLLAVLVGVRTPEAPQAAQATSAAPAKKPAQVLAKKLSETRKEAAERGLPDADLALKPLEEAVKNLADKNNLDKKQALVALNDLVKGTQERRKELAGAAELKQQFSQLKDLEQGPAHKLAQALKAGDMQQASQELGKLAEQVAGEKLDAETKQALARQLNEMQESLAKRAEAQREAEDKLKQQMEAERRAGNTAGAEKLQQQLDRLQAKQAQREELDKMADALKQASEHMQKGQNKQAAEKLDEMAQQMENMGEKLEEMEMIDQALDQVADAKSAMACEKCRGEGCQACQAQNARDPLGGNDSRPGVGIGANRRGNGQADASFIDSQVKQQVGRGAGIVTGQADGPNRKGRVQEEIQGAFSTADQQATEALSSQRLPHDYRDHAEKYFDSLREGRK